MILLPSALQGKFKLEWDHKINYWSVHQKAFPITPAVSHTSFNRTTGIGSWDNDTVAIHNTVLTDIHSINFRIFLQKVYSRMANKFQQAQDKSTNNHALWQKWIWKGMTSNSTFNTLSRK